MAEGWAKKIFPDIESYSAGVMPQGLNPIAVTAMAEMGVDISGHRSKHLDELAGLEFDLVITVCDSAREQCPFFAAAKKMIHQSFEDPPLLAKSADSEAEVLSIYRRVRDEIKQLVATLPNELS
jgi:arsenate reductase